MKRYVVILTLVLLLFIVTIGVATAAPEAQGGGLVIHYVGFGDSLYGIAAQYGVSAEAIMRQNGLIDPDLIYVGQPLVIPGTGSYGHPVGSAPYAACGSHHMVQAGDTLSSIAFHYGVSLEGLLAHNQLYNKDIVYVGQKICVPGASRPTGYQNYAPSADDYYHTVVNGDTLTGIAHRYGVDYHRIMRINSLSNPGFIWIGQRLLIPGYQPAPPRLPPAAPPRVPEYDDAYDETYEAPPPPPPPYDKTGVYDLPTAPDYQPSPVTPELPVAGQPIEVVVNGGESWVGESFPPFDDPDSITTLIVSTDDKTEPRTVRIRSGDYEVKGELGLVPEFGVDKFRFAFRYIPPGDYDVWIDDPDTPSEKVQVKVEPGRRVEALFRKGLGFSGPTFASPDGWFLASWSNPSKPGERIGGWSNITVQAPASGLWVMIESEGRDYKAKCFTGTKGPGKCDLAALNAGIYYLWIDGTDLTVKTYMDGNAYATFEFGRQAVPAGDDEEVGPVSYN